MNSAFVFPGQGSQFVGMGKDLFDNSELKAQYEMVDKLFASFHQENYSQILSNVVFQGPEEDLTKTVFTQPAILTMSMLLAEKLKAKIAAGEIQKPAFVAGHSLGEFAALFMADVLSFEDAMKLVIARAAFMQEAPKGAMTAIIGMNDQDVKAFTDKADDVSVANFNSPEQVVITGTKEGVERVSCEISEFAATNGKKVRVIALNVGGAFHSPLMQAPAEEFNKLIDEMTFNDASIPVVQNTTASPVTAASEIKENLKKQMTGSVRWTETVKFFFDNGVKEILEVGPGKVLAGLVKKQDRRFPVQNIASLEDLASLQTAVS